MEVYLVTMISDLSVLKKNNNFNPFLLILFWKPKYNFCIICKWLRYTNKLFSRLQTLISFPRKPLCGMDFCLKKMMMFFMLHLWLTCENSNTEKSFGLIMITLECWNIFFWHYYHWGSCWKCKTCLIYTVAYSKKMIMFLFAFWCFIHTTSQISSFWPGFCCK